MMRGRTSMIEKSYISEQDKARHSDTLEEAWAKSPIQTAFTRVTLPDKTTCFIFWKQSHDSQHQHPTNGWRKLTKAETNHVKNLTWRPSGKNK